MQFVALGQDVQLTATIPKKFTNYQNADLNLRLDHGGTTATLLNTRIALANGTGTRTWNATGLLPKELSAIVDVTWTGRGVFNKTVTQQLFVYRPEVELLAVDGNGTPVRGAAYEAKMQVHPSYTGLVAPVQLSGTTNGQGKATISNLPPLASLEVRWKNPNLLSDRGWLTENDFTPDGAKRKAVLRAGYRAQLVGVTANDELTRYVNVPLDDQDSSAGPLVTIRAKVHAEDGGGARGDRIWARVTWGGSNSTRTDKCPTLDGASLVEAAGRNETKLVAVKALGADNGEVVFNFDCGVAGGDTFSIWVGGDEHAEDDGPVKITTKRKLRLEPYFPPNYPYADKLFCEDFKQKLIKGLAAAEIELEIADPATITYGTGLHGYPRPREVAADVSERIGWEREIHFVYTHSSLFSPIADSFKAVAAYPTIRAFYADTMVTINDRGQSFKVEGLTSRTSDWITSGGRATGFYQCDFDGGSMLAPFQNAKPEEHEYGYVYLWDEGKGDFIDEGQPGMARTHAWAVERKVVQKVERESQEPYPAYIGKLVPIADAPPRGRTLIPLNSSGLPQGYKFASFGYAEQTIIKTKPAIPEAWGEWRTADDQHGPITMDHIEIDMEEPNKFMRFRFQLPQEANVSADNPATATVGLRTVSGGTAGSSSGCAIILFNNEGVASDKAAYTLLHEIGHSLGQSWSDKDPRPAGITIDEKYLYGSSVTGHRSNRGHQGPHCAYGLADQYLSDQYDYGKLLDEEGKHGTCVMFGGIGPKTVYTEQSRKFCPKCMPTIKAQDLSRIAGGVS